MIKQVVEEISAGSKWVLIKFLIKKENTLKKTEDNIFFLILQSLLVCIKNMQHAPLCLCYEM